MTDVRSAFSLSSSDPGSGQFESGRFMDHVKYLLRYNNNPHVARAGSDGFSNCVP